MDVHGRFVLLFCEHLLHFVPTSALTFLLSSVPGYTCAKLQERLRKEEVAEGPVQ